MTPIKTKAFSLLARRSHFSKELALKLSQKGYPQTEVNSIIKELQKNGWLNDRELAKNFAMNKKSRGYGAKIITHQLKEKAGEIDLFLTDSEEEVKKFIKKRYCKDLPEKQNKVIRALLRRGFSYDLIHKVLTSMSSP